MKFRFLYFSLVWLAVLSFSCSEEPGSSVTPPTATGISSAPRNLMVYSLPNSASLTWEAPQTNGGTLITKYNIYRGTVSGNYSLAGSVGAGEEAFFDRGVVDGTLYFYTVTAVNINGESGMTPEVQVMPGGTPTAPLNLTVRTGNTQVLLEWRAPAYTGGFALMNYNLYRHTLGSDTAIISLPPQATSYTDINLTNNTEYYYYITAVNLIGESPHSNHIAVIPVQTTNDPNVFLFFNKQLTIGITEPPVSSINLFTGRVTAVSNSSRDVDLIDNSGTYHLRSSHLGDNAVPGYEIGFYTNLISANMPFAVFDTLSRINDNDDSLTANEFPFSSTLKYSNSGSFTYPLQGNPVFAFYLKGKHIAGLNNSIPILGIIRVDSIVPAGPGFTITVSFKINISGRNRFY